jgi:hypothetical protein
MTSEQQIAVVFASMLLTYAILLTISDGYRNDSVKVFRLEMTMLTLWIKHPFALLAHLFSFFVPLYLMGLR